MPIKKFINNWISIWKYSKHNRRTFSRNIPGKKTESIILVEFNFLHSSHIAYSYLANALATNYGSKIYAYKAKINQEKFVLSLIRQLAFNLLSLLNVGIYRVYRSFGTERFIYPSLSKEQKKEAQGISDRIAKKIQHTRDIENIEIEGIWIGDLIYDTYLRTYSKPTIDLYSKQFIIHLFISVSSYIYWRDYIDKNNIVSIIVSHCVYNLAIPLRIAVSRDIDVFQANISSIYRLDSSRLFAYTDFTDYKKVFSKLPKDKQLAAISKAKERVQRRLNGEIGIDMPYSKKSAFGKISYKSLLRKTENVKILIATHCFFDSPHSFGKNLFPDFLEWLNFLGDLSEELDYDWYIKTHPDYLPGTKLIIDKYLQKYQKISLLPPDSSHHQIVEEGINYALTCYGTIGFEYAVLGVPVINASINNPHISFNFNLHPRNVKEYESLIRNIKSIHHEINDQEVYAFYFMHHLYRSKNIFFDKYEKTISELGGYSKQFTSTIYEEWLKQISSEKHHRIFNEVTRYVDSKKYRMSTSEELSIIE